MNPTNTRAPPKNVPKALIARYIRKRLCRSSFFWKVKCAFSGKVSVAAVAAEIRLAIAGGVSKSERKIKNVIRSRPMPTKPTQV